MEATTETDVNGYYSFGALNHQIYLLGVEESGYSFFERPSWVDIPQEWVKAYDFIATDSIIGSWERGSILLTFLTDFTWMVKGNVVGTYTLSGNQITLHTGECGTDGIYTYSVNENTLTFVEVSDPCSIVSGDYVRQ